MTAELFLHEAALLYTLLLLAILTIMLAACIFHSRSHNWKLRRMSLYTCKKCSMVFTVGRFVKDKTRVCPHCGTVTGKRKSQSKT